jgi:predicted nuclease of restriction endonuclease-like (RecB) superfamily
MISEKENVWGSKLIEHVAKDLREEVPEMKGLSGSNLSYAKQFFNFYQAEFVQQPVGQIGQQLVTQIPWGHNILIFSKSKTITEAHFYINQTLENGWSRDVLALHIKSQLYQQQGKSITNFKQTLPEPLSDLAQQTLKDPYIFDFLTRTKPYHEKDIEHQLMGHITRFLLELGKGFAFIGRQYHLHVGETDYYIDLLFYHIKLRCYVVIELKNTKFIPEYAGKLNFYLSAVDSLVKSDKDLPTIGILLCRDKNNFETEFALRDINKSMGVSEFQLTEILPEELRSSLPSIEEIENELKKLE